MLIAPAAPRLITDLVVSLGLPGTACFQFDLYQAERLRHELGEIGVDAEVHTAADLWDVTPRFGTFLLPSPPRGKRELKRDLVEQSHHILDDGGRLVVLSPLAKDQFYPDLIKKTFGQISSAVSKSGTIVWSARTAEKPRRRHEIAFHMREGERSLALISRPGVFSYGRLDDGARALTEGMAVKPGDRILDLGCGIGAVGIIAGLRALGQGAHVTFADSNLRAVALGGTECGPMKWRISRSMRPLNSKGSPIDHSTSCSPTRPIMRSTRSPASSLKGRSDLLARGGRLNLVTKQADVVGEIVAEIFGEPTIELHRGYAVLSVRKKSASKGQ